VARTAAREAKLAAERAALEQQRQAYEQAQKEAAELRERVKRYETLEADPLAFIAHKGLTPQQLLEMAAKHAPADPVALEAKRIAEENAKRLQEMQEQTLATTRQAQIAQYRGRIEALAEEGGERWEFIRAEGIDSQYVLNSAAHYVKTKGINPTTPAEERAIFEKVLDQMEAYAEKQLEKARGLGKYQKKWGQPAPAKPAEPAKPGAKPPAPTLTNRAEVTAPPKDPPKTRWSREQDLLLAKQKWATPGAK
jgi:hypothetical protein